MRPNIRRAAIVQAALRLGARCIGGRRETAHDQDLAGKSQHRFGKPRLAIVPRQEADDLVKLQDVADGVAEDLGEVADQRRHRHVDAGGDVDHRQRQLLGPRLGLHEGAGAERHRHHQAADAWRRASWP